MLFSGFRFGFPRYLIPHAITSIASSSGAGVRNAVPMLLFRLKESVILYTNPPLAVTWSRSSFLGLREAMPGVRSILFSK